jgi:hypothetical protein
MRERNAAAVKRVHPYRWLWEPLESDPTFVLRPMFGGHAAYLDGKLMLFFVSRDDPWRGVLVGMEREAQAALRGELRALVPHPILPKWLYLPEKHDAFEQVAERLVALAARRDPRLGVSAAHKKKPKRKSVLRPLSVDRSSARSKSIRRGLRGRKTKP